MKDWDLWEQEKFEVVEVWVREELEKVKLQRQGRRVVKKKKIYVG